MKIFSLINLIMPLASASAITWIYLGIADLSLILDNFYKEGDFDITGYLSELGLRQLLFAIGIFIAVAVLYHEKTQKLIASFGMRGNILIPILFLIYLALIVGYIFLNNISHLIQTSDSYERLDLLISVLLLASISFIFLPYLVSLNSELKAPASITVVTAPFLVSFFALIVWYRYVTTGEIDFLW